MDLGNRQPNPDHPFVAHSGISDAHGANELSRGCRQFAAMGSLVLLSGRLHALVGCGVARPELPTHDDRSSGSVPVRHRGQLPAPGLDWTAACATGPTVVRRDGWILGWRYAGNLDRECSGLDPVPLYVRVQR